MESQDILQLIPDEKLPELKQLFLKDWPNTSYVYNFIDRCMHWRKSVPTENYVLFYCPHGDFSDGTFVVVMKLTLCYIFIYTLDKSHKRLELTLNETKIIDWKNKPLFIGMNTNYLEMLLKIGKEKCCHTPTYPLGNMFWLPREKAREYKYSIPSELYVGVLQQHHIPLINSTWPHSSPGTEVYLVKLLQLNAGIGLFLKDSNELCAWVLQNCFGGLGMLQTDEKHRRKGYGTLLIKIFSKMLAEKGTDPTSTIYQYNEVSKNLFKSLGFQSKLEITWCQF